MRIGGYSLPGRRGVWALSISSFPKFPTKSTTSFLLERWETVSAQPCLTTITSFFFTQQESTSPNLSSLFYPGKPTASCLLLLHKMKHLVECLSSCYQCLLSSSNFLDGLFFIRPQLSFLTLHSSPMPQNMAPTTGREPFPHTVCIRDFLVILLGIAENISITSPIALVHITVLNVPKPNHELF